jgi:hypothetical protein
MGEFSGQAWGRLYIHFRKLKVRFYDAESMEAVNSHFNVRCMFNSLELITKNATYKANLRHWPCTLETFTEILLRVKLFYVYLSTTVYVLCMAARS